MQWLPLLSPHSFASQAFARFANYNQWLGRHSAQKARRVSPLALRPAVSHGLPFIISGQANIAFTVLGPYKHLSPCGFASRRFQRFANVLERYDDTRSASRAADANSAALAEILAGAPLLLPV